MSNTKNKTKKRASGPGSRSKYHGVTGREWSCGKSKKRGARILLNGKRKFLGLYDTEEEAAAVYEAAVRERDGKLAKRSLFTGVIRIRESFKASAKHTPEPWWRDDDGCVAAGSGDTYVTVADPGCSEELDAGERGANADRIVACVNACAGIADPGRAIADILGALEEIAAENPEDLPDREELRRCATIARRTLIRHTPLEL